MKKESASVVCVGTELLMGNITNTNSRYIASRLAELGISLYREFSVGDNPARMKETFAQALESGDIVIVTGGLGPTRDDITKETVCELFGVPLIHSAEAEENIRTRLRGRQISENNMKQAQVPEGARVFFNSRGTAPGFALTKGEKTVIAMPGVPHEMEQMFEEWVYPLLAGDRVILSRNLHICGMGESRVDSLLGELAARANPTVAPYCGNGETRLRLSARADSREEAQRLLASLEEEIRRTGLRDHIYFVTESDRDAEHAPALAALARLRGEGKTVAFAESITGGLLGKMITDISGSSRYFRGSAVTYATEAKIAVLGVKGETVEKHGVVSEEVAAEMALGARRIFASDIAVGITGLAEASPGYSGSRDARGEEIPAGTVCIAIAEGDSVRLHTARFGSGHGRDYVRRLSAGRVMHLLSGYRGEFV